MDAYPDDSDTGEMGVGENLGAYGLLEFYETTIDENDRGKFEVTKLRIVPNFLGAGPHVVFANRADTNEYLLRPIKSQRIIRVPASMVDARGNLGFPKTKVALVAAGVLSFVMCLICAGVREEDKLRDPVPAAPKNVKPPPPRPFPLQELDIDWKRRVNPPDMDVPFYELRDQEKKEFDRNPLIDPNNPGKR